MSHKNYDDRNRWRSKQVSFRLSPEEADLLDAYVSMSGKSKQEYVTDRLLNREVVVQGNPRVFKVLRDRLDAVLSELRRIEAGGAVGDDLLDVVRMIVAILDGLRGEGSE